MIGNLALDPVDIGSVFGERSELERANDTARALLGQLESSVSPGRFVNALALFGIEETHARAALRALVRDGHARIENKSLLRTSF